MRKVILYTAIVSGLLLSTIPITAQDMGGFFGPAYALRKVAFASLGTPADGAIRYCTDCSTAAPCTGGGTGAVASRVNGAWNCSSGSSSGAANPFSDATPIVKNSVDGTKQVTLSAASVSTTTTRTITVPDANTTLIVAAQPFTFLGTTAARSMTWPDAAITVARTDAAQSFTGNQTFSGNIIAAAGSASAPSVTGTGALTSGMSFPANAVSLSVNAAQQLALTANSTRIGPSDAATAAAQAITVPNVVAGTTNVAGADTTLNGSQGTGTGAGGKWVFKAAGAGNTGTAQNAENTIVTLQDSGTAATSAPQILAGSIGTAGLPFYSFGAAATAGMYSSGGNVRFAVGGVLAAEVQSTNIVIFSTSGQYLFGSSADAGIKWAAAGLVKAVGSGGAAGDFQVPTGALTAGTMTVTNSAYARTVLHRFDWTNAMITALGAVTAGDIAVCTLPAKTKVLNAYVIINTPDTSTNALSVAVGRTSASYIDYIVASDAKATANTIYGNTSGTRGTNLNGFDLPSVTGTTVVNAHFIKTTTNLSTVLGSTGSIYIETATLP